MISAAQASTGHFKSAAISSRLDVLPAEPMLGHFADIAKTYGDSSFRLNPPAAPGAYTYTSSAPTIASISGDRVTIHLAGTVAITAALAASGNYASGSATAQLTIAKATPEFYPYTLKSKTVGDIPYAIPAPASVPSGGQYSYESSNSSIATVSNGILTLTGAWGQTTITATRLADTNYSAASKTATLTVAPAPTPSDTVWNALDKGPNLILKNSLVVQAPNYSSGQWELVRANTGKSTGKFVFELTTSTNATSEEMGIADGAAAVVGRLGTSGVSLGLQGGSAIYKSGITTTFSGAGATRYMFAVDLDAGKGWIARDGVWLASGSPSTGVNHSFAFTPNTTLFPAAGLNTDHGYYITANFGATAFSILPPSGFTPGWY